MLTFYKTVGSDLEELDAPEAGCWISAVAPTEAEISMLEDDLGIDRGFIRSALDEEESSRIESGDGQTLIVLDYPLSEKNNDNQSFSYYTMPMSIILTESCVITVSLKENPIMTDFSSGVVRNVRTQFRTQFIFTILLRIAAKYLQFLKQIDKLFNYVQKMLHRSMQNKFMIQLLDLEKSLVYFSTSLKSTESVLERLLRGRIIKLYDEDQDLLEDVLVEVKQAIEMSNIYSNILSNSMEAYSNIISNNLNQVMKVLTVITIVLELPNMVFGFYGMNTNDLPMPYTWFAMTTAVVLAIAAGVLIIKSRFYK